MAKKRSRISRSRSRSGKKLRQHVMKSRKLSRALRSVVGKCKSYRKSLIKAKSKKAKRKYRSLLKKCVKRTRSAKRKMKKAVRDLRLIKDKVDETRY